MKNVVQLLCAHAPSKTPTSRPFFFFLIKNKQTIHNQQWQNLFINYSNRIILDEKIYIYIYNWKSRTNEYLCFFVSDGVETEATLSVIKETEILICFGNWYNICQSKSFGKKNYNPDQKNANYKLRNQRSSGEASYLMQCCKQCKSTLTKWQTQAMK